MSVSIILIPAAIAAIATAAAGGTAAAGVGIGVAGAIRSMTAGGGVDEPAVLQVRTRMRDRGLLAEALKDLGAVDVEAGAEVAATVDGIQLVMRQTPEGVWAADFTPAPGRPAVTTEEATKLAEQLDAAYAARVQTAVAQRIRERASDAGLDLVSETVGENREVTMVLDVRAGA